MKNTLIKYLRNKNGEPRGVTVAIRNGDEVFYGYSLRNPIDPWDKQKGLKIAIHRAMAGEYHLPEAPNTYKEIIDNFQGLSERAMKYFKDVPQGKVAFWKPNA